MEGVPGPSSEVIEPRDPISCENCFLSYGDFCFVFRQKRLIAGICSVAWDDSKRDIRKRGGTGGRSPQLRINAGGYVLGWLGG